MRLRYLRSLLSIALILLCVLAQTGGAQDPPSSSAAGEGSGAAPPAAEVPVPDFVPGSWTLAVLPDTQHYSQSYPGLFYAQTAWLAEQRSARNIAFVLQLGDITNNNTPEEWVNARAAMRQLDNVLPYALVPGNHDYGPNGNASSRETLLNEYFPYEHMSSLPGFGGAMEPGKLDNSYYFFEAGGTDWIVIGLEWAPQDETIAWAAKVLEQHPEHRGILITHAYMNNNDLRYDHHDTAHPQQYNPHEYKTPGTINDGEELWQKLVRSHDVPLVLNGHVLGDGTGYLVSLNDAGRQVHQMLSNYQMRELGGEGYLRLLEFLPDGKTVQVKTYSVLYGRYMTAPDQQFSFELD